MTIKNPKVKMQIEISGDQLEKGDLLIELYPDKAPFSVENFLNYVRSGFYNGTIFHRVIDGFMIQGGGFESGFKEKESRPPIINEANNGLKNEIGTVAMARTMEIHSATSQFFINVADNEFLNFKNDSPQGYGYAVFGKVIEGMDFVNKIKSIQTKSVSFYDDVPVRDVVITSVEIH